MRSINILTTIGLLSIIGVIGCADDEEVYVIPVPALMEIPSGFPNVEAPENNVFSVERWNLGKMLFYDNIMSADTSLSCASCHQQALAFSDQLPVSLGVDGRLGSRNAPSLANVAYHPYFLREGGVPTLEFQILVPIQEHDEFDFNIVRIADRLKNDPKYVAMAQEAYQRAPDPFVITRSIACFERSLISGNSPFDRYTQFGETEQFSTAAARGMELFNSNRLNCSACHSGFNFTTYAFENNGLYRDYVDEGRLRFTHNEADRALFKVPSIRNIGLTAPYMHDGSINTLEEVLAHYETGGKSHINKSELIKPFTLTQTERADILKFLHSLTDEVFISNPLFN